VTARVEVYGRRLSHLLVARLETDEERRARVSCYDYPALLRGDIPSAPEPTSEPSDEGRGHAYGVEAQLLRRPTGASERLGGWLSYTYAVAARDAYGIRFAARYDRRHAASAVAQVRLRPGLALSFTARAASGLPTTPALRTRIAAESDTNDADGDGNRTELVPARDRAGRLLYVNDLLNRHNAGFVDYVIVGSPTNERPRIERENQMWVPFLPTIGARFRF